MPSEANETRRASALLIGIGSFLSVVLMAHHPSTGAGDTASLVEELSREAALTSGVHGGLIALMGCLLLGFTGFSEHLGLEKLRIRAALGAYGLGIAFMIVAAMVSGFIVPGLASRYASEAAAASVLESVRPTLRLCFQANQSAAEAGTVAMSIAILLWSWALLVRSGPSRAIGAFGLAVGAVPPLALLVGRLELDVHGMGAVVLAQAVWSVAVAVWLYRRR
ncbi:MAG TPA: hypothetical protein VEK15_07995 [Vicinamibacteria bacterium]|nr:hypothetical protein [Vicinamibacteria bacterium]